jgi:hypothetical protein
VETGRQLAEGGGKRQAMFSLHLGAQYNHNITFQAKIKYFYFIDFRREN